MDESAVIREEVWASKVLQNHCQPGLRVSPEILGHQEQRGNGLQVAHKLEAW